MEILKVQNVEYIYEGTTNGIRNISFEANEGDLIAVVGKNGAGKSTFLNLLSGIYQPQKGEITCLPSLSYHDLGISTQRQSIDWYLTVTDNVMLGAMLAGLKKKEAQAATQNILEKLDLHKFNKRSPDALSGGQQQRIQIARALVHNPKIMILDEPTTGLDYNYSLQLFEYLKQKVQQEQKVVLVSSHDLAMLEEYCNKILYIESGQQIYFGKMEDFLNTEEGKQIGLKDIMSATGGTTS